MSHAGTIAVLTGASGFVATHIAKALLESGYTVRATVRDASNEAKVAHLKALAAALPGTIELYSADLLTPGAFDEVVSGAHYVFHSASPVVMQSDNPQQDVVDPAVKGTLNVLSSVVKSKSSVKRVILTSSTAAIMSLAAPEDKTPPKNGKAYNEADWNADSTLLVDPYPLSKVEAEKAAWKVAETEHLDLVAINPVYVLGPVIGGQQVATSPIVQAFSALLTSDSPSMFNSGQSKNIVDARDVALAHVRAAELPTASGRYLLAAMPMGLTSTKAVDTIRELYPGITIADAVPIKADTPLDASKAIKELGITFRPEEETLADMARTLIVPGFYKPNFAAKQTSANGSA